MLSWRISKIVQQLESNDIRGSLANERRVCSWRQRVEKAGVVLPRLGTHSCLLLVHRSIGSFGNDEHEKKKKNERFQEQSKRISVSCLVNSSTRFLQIQLWHSSKNCTLRTRWNICKKSQAVANLKVTVFFPLLSPCQSSLMLLLEVPSLDVNSLISLTFLGISSWQKWVLILDFDINRPLM